MQQGRRTASLKASYEAAIHLGASGGTSSGHELLIGKDLAGAAQTALQAVEREGSTSHRRQKKYYLNLVILRGYLNIINYLFFSFAPYINRSIFFLFWSS